MFNRLRFPALVFFISSLLGLLQIYYAIGGSGWRISISAIAYGLILGFVVQLCFREAFPKMRVGVAAFCGAYTLWIPVILVTYGFALTATPVFVGYAGAVMLGSHMAVLLRKGCSIDSPA